MKTKFICLLIAFFFIMQGVFAGKIFVSNTQNAGTGSLRDAIAQANVTPGIDTIWFNIPVTDPGYNSIRGVFTIKILSPELPVITKSGLVIDGSSQSLFTGNTNPVMLGSGGEVGVEQLPFSRVDGPEIEIVDYSGLKWGFYIRASGVIIKGFSIYGFGVTNAVPIDQGNIVINGGGVKQVLIENNVLGTFADVIAKPDSAFLTGTANVVSYYADSGIIRNNIVAWSKSMGLYLYQGSDYWLIEGNEVLENAFNQTFCDGIDIAYSSVNAIVKRNLIYNNGGQGLDLYLTGGNHLVVNNTIRSNGFQDNENSGIRVYGTGSLFTKNIMNNNRGAGIIITSGSLQNTISQNSIFENGSNYMISGLLPTRQLGIDLINASQNAKRGSYPFYTINDTSDFDAGGNELINHPVIEKVDLYQNTVVIKGFARPGSLVEFFIGDTITSKLYPQGKTYLFAATEGSVNDNDNLWGSYGPAPVNGISQGKDSTTRFSFQFARPSSLQIGTIITSTATLNQNTSEFSSVVYANTLPDSITPFLDCVYENTNGTLTAVMGYENPNANSVVIPIGLSNEFVPGPASQGQPTIFLAGIHHNAFNYLLTGSSVIWNLNGKSIAVSMSSPRCPVDVGVSKIVDKPSININDTVTFTIHSKNFSSVYPTTNISILDTLPSVFTYVSSTSSIGTYNNLTGIWTIPQLLPMDSAVLTITAIVTASGDNQVKLLGHSQVDDNLLNNQAFAGVTATNSSGGNNGGLESNGNLASLLAKRNFKRLTEKQVNYESSNSLVPFVREDVLNNLVPITKSGGAKNTELINFIPQTGPESSSAFITTPVDLIGVTNAIEVFSVDYFNSLNNRKAVIFAVATNPGSVYNHTKVICDRLNGAVLEKNVHVMIHENPFILSHLVQNDGTVDYAVSFVAYKTIEGYVIDNKWNNEQYAPLGNQPVLNFQVWSVSEAYTINMVNAILTSIQQQYNVQYINKFPAAIPLTYVKSGYYNNGKLHFNISNSAQATSMYLFGSKSKIEDGARIHFDTVINITPDPSLQVELNTNYIFDAGFSILNDASGGMDVLYYADGPWGTDYDITGATQSSFETFEQTTSSASNELNLERDATFSGTVKTYASLFRSLKVANIPVNLSAYGSIEFTASGTGSFDLVISKKSIYNWSQQYRTTINLTNQPTVYTIPFSQLTNYQGLYNFDPSDVTAVTFTKRGDYSTYQNFSISVKNAKFIESGIGVNPIIDKEALTLDAYPNPFNNSTQINFQVPEEGKVSIKVYDLTGKELMTLSDSYLEEGDHTIMFTPQNLPKGVYFCKLQTESNSLTTKLILVK